MAGVRAKWSPNTAKQLGPMGWRDLHPRRQGGCQYPMAPRMASLRVAHPNVSSAEGTDPRTSETLTPTVMVPILSGGH